MDSRKRYITQLTVKDMAELAAAANAHGGEGIDVIPTADGLEISIDRSKFTRWVKTIINGGAI